MALPSRIDSYEIQGTLGSGASGTVQLAYQAELRRYVAIKVLSPWLVADPYFLQRFRAEAQVMARLDSPNCVKVFDFIDEPGRAWMVCEYVEGASLQKVFEQAGFLTPEQALGVLKGALTGLAHAHSMGLVHRDLKPANVIADREGVSKLVDFGQAHFSPGPGAAGGLPSGTPAFMSPEQVTGGPLDYRSDIYSAGAMLFQFLTGKPPYAADTPLAMMRMHANEPVPDPRSVNSALPQGVAQMVMRAMAKEPVDRQRSALEFLAELQQAAAAGYGDDWEKRSSIKRLVAAIVAAGGVLMPSQAAAVGDSGATGAATVTAEGAATAAGEGMATRTRWLIAGGVAGALIIAAAVFAFGSGMFGGRHQGTVAVSRPTPSPSPSTSPLASPSPAASPSPSASPAPAGKAVAVSGLAVWYQSCLLDRGFETCTKPAQDGSAFSIQQTATTADCSGGSSPHYFKFFEQFSYVDQNPAGNSVNYTLRWTGLLPNGRKDPGPASYPGGTFTPTPGTTHSAGSAPGYADATAGSQPNGSGWVRFELDWSNPDGSHGHSTSPMLWYVCGRF